MTESNSDQITVSRFLLSLESGESLSVDCHRNSLLDFSGHLSCCLSLPQEAAFS